jgi:uncharacterized SAM-binding protein YcdF (DUF218 family)
MKTFAMSVLAVIGLVTLLISIAAWTYGRALVEKVVTELALSCGLIWLGLWTLTVYSFVERQRGIGALALVTTLVYTLGGGSYQARFFSDFLEGEMVPVRFQECPVFDYVVLLGGGTDSLPNSCVELSLTGDRVMLAARLYHAGKAAKIVATGGLYPWNDEETVSQASGAKRLLMDLRVPDADIIELPGRNTTEEFGAISEFFASKAPDRRIGLITSAVHMPRALRLARAQGIDPQPLPADFEREPLRPIVRKIIPTPEGFRKCSRSVKELLAGLVGR